jgi:hypothetical protein
MVWWGLRPCMLFRLAGCPESALLMIQEIHARTCPLLAMFGAKALERRGNSTTPLLRNRTTPHRPCLTITCAKTALSACPKASCQAHERSRGPEASRTRGASPPVGGFRGLLRPASKPPGLPLHVLCQARVSASRMLPDWRVAPQSKGRAMQGSDSQRFETAGASGKPLLRENGLHAA